MLNPDDLIVAARRSRSPTLAPASAAAGVAQEALRRRHGPPFPANPDRSRVYACVWDAFAAAGERQTQVMRRVTWTAVVGVVAAVLTLACAGRGVAVAAIAVGAVVAALITLAYTLFMKCLPKGVVLGGAVVAVLCIILGDTVLARSGDRLWALFLLVTQGLRGINAGRGICSVVLAIALAHLVLVELEYTLRYGLFAAPWLPHARSDGDSGGVGIACADPPCATHGYGDFVSNTLWKAVALLFGNALITLVRSLLRCEREVPPAVVQMAQALANALSSFDLDTAEAHLAQLKHELPEDSLVAYKTIILNLRSFQPYIPQSCFAYDKTDCGEEAEAEEEPSSDTRSSTTAPSVGGPAVAVEQPHRLRRLRLSSMESSIATTGVSWSDQCPSSPTASDGGSTDFAQSRASSPTGCSGQSVPASPVSARSTRASMLPPSVAQAAQPGGYSRDHSPRGLLDPVRNVFRAVRATLLNASFQPTQEVYRALLASGTTSTASSLHERFIAAAVDAVAAHRGIVDDILGERVSSSFNASRGCAMHAKMAAQAAKAFHETMTKSLLPDELGTVIVGAVACGTVHVGVLGTESVRRHAMLGELPRLVEQLERYAYVANVPLVCNYLAFIDAAIDNPMRILLHKWTYPRRYPHLEEPPQGVIAKRASSASAASTRSILSVAAHAAAAQRAGLGPCVPPAAVRRATTDAGDPRYAREQMDSPKLHRPSSFGIFGMGKGGHGNTSNADNVPVNTASNSSSNLPNLPVVSAGSLNMASSSSSVAANALSVNHGRPPAQPQGVQAPLQPRERIDSPPVSRHGSFGVFSSPMPPSVALGASLANADKHHGIVYEILPQVVGSDRDRTSQTSSAESYEWMYEMREAAGAVWDTYNDAGLQYHKHGVDPGLAYLANATPRHQAMFKRKLRSALTIDFNPQVRRGSVCHSSEASSRVRLSHVTIRHASTDTPDSESTDGTVTPDRDIEDMAIPRLSVPSAT